MQKSNTLVTLYAYVLPNESQTRAKQRMLVEDAESQGKHLGTELEKLRHRNVVGPLTRLPVLNADRTFRAEGNAHPVFGPIALPEHR